MLLKSPWCHKTWWRSCSTIRALNGSWNCCSRRLNHSSSDYWLELRCTPGWQTLVGGCWSSDARPGQQKKRQSNCGCWRCWRSNKPFDSVGHPGPLSLRRPFYCLLPSSDVRLPSLGLDNKLKYLWKFCKSFVKVCRNYKQEQQEMASKDKLKRLKNPSTIKDRNHQGNLLQGVRGSSEVNIFA